MQSSRLTVFIVSGIIRDKATRGGEEPSPHRFPRPKIHTHTPTHTHTHTFTHTHTQTDRHRHTTRHTKLWVNCAGENRDSMEVLFFLKVIDKFSYFLQ